jgi:hypothetical protein
MVRKRPQDFLLKLLYYSTVDITVHLVSYDMDYWAHERRAKRAQRGLRPPRKESQPLRRSRAGYPGNELGVLDRFPYEGRAKAYKGITLTLGHYGFLSYWLLTRCIARATGRGVPHMVRLRGQRRGACINHIRQWYDVLR